MRLWHYKLLPYLPELQFKGQLRELVLIANDIIKKGKTNHILINRVMDYPTDELYFYFKEYEKCYYLKYGKTLNKYEPLFKSLYTQTLKYTGELFHNWHDKEYLKICMANLYEKAHFAKGKSAISLFEWHRLLYGYKIITGEEWEL